MHLDLLRTCRDVASNVMRYTRQGWAFLKPSDTNFGWFDSMIKEGILRLHAYSQNFIESNSTRRLQREHDQRQQQSSNQRHEFIAITVVDGSDIRSNGLCTNGP